MKLKEKYIQISLVIITLVMTILRFLLNEKGRTNPDSIRYMRFAHVFPEIDNTTTPLGYPLFIKFFTFFGTDEFWSSKIVGIFSFLFIVCFAWRKNFFLKETIVICSLFSFLSIFAFTMSEALILPFVFLFTYCSNQIINAKLTGEKAVFYLSISLIALYNIRYSSLFFIGGTGFFGLLFWKKAYSKIFIVSAIVGLGFIIGYKFLFIDYFNSSYLDTFLEIGLYPTSKLLAEFGQGLATTFNPFIHISNPAGGMINYAIYGIGIINIVLMMYLFLSKKLNESEKFILTIGVFGIICSYFIQYFYAITPLDYRLLAPFSFMIWLLYFKKMFENFGSKVYAIGFLSLCSGLLFTILSKGNYLENRRAITQFLKNEKLEKTPLLYYLENEEDLEKIQIAELISTVNPNIDLTFKPSDTLKRKTLTYYKVLQKIKIDKNKYQ
ncbi:MAG: hypothetical protein K0R77_1526 [Chryseobacterium sp.]|jgi:hypothetical protein|uniref:hypothetical protein n=1 Tax=Chryseobacterium sp. TaxID=1871047 RepID=UPI00261D25BB|nr:hypothetical protein [Chryseobacterium sp.]MDF2552251.1 hypothetical protein [Chryseobacterium sp.]